MNTEKKKSLYPKSETIEIKRSQINFAPYNPRKENKKVVDELKRNFKKVGFLGGIVWNSQTGNLVGGHKRVQALDLIHDYPENNYMVKVEMVDIDLKTEMEQNIFLNNKKVQGEMDYSLLAVMINDGIEIQNCGLDDSDVQMLTAIVPNFEVEPIQNKIAEFEAPYQERKEQIKELKKNIKEDIFKDQKASYVTISFSSWDAKCEFMSRFGFNTDDLYIKGELFNGMIEMCD